MGLSVLAFHRAQNRFDGGNIGAVLIELFVARRKTVLVDDQRQNQLLAVGTTIPCSATRMAPNPGELHRDRPDFSVSFVLVRPGSVELETANLIYETSKFFGSEFTTFGPIFALCTAFPAPARLPAAHHPPLELRVLLPLAVYLHRQSRYSS